MRVGAVEAAIESATKAQGEDDERRERNEKRTTKKRTTRPRRRGMHWGRHFELEAGAARVGLGTRRPKITCDPGAARYRKALMKKKNQSGISTRLMKSAVSQFEK